MGRTELLRERGMTYRELEQQELWGKPIVTEVAPFSVFYPAEDYHQEYFQRNPYQGYCVAVAGLGATVAFAPTLAPRSTSVGVTFHSVLNARGILSLVKTTLGPMNTSS